MIRRLWSYGLPVYLPSVLYGIGAGAILPVIPFSVRDLGGSAAASGIVVGVLGLGAAVGTLPAGQLVMRVGERRAMLLATAGAIAALTLCVLAPSVPVLAVGLGVVGISTAVFGLARYAYLTEVVPFGLRARALATLGGTHRIGVFIGPFAGAAVLRLVGSDGGYWVHMAAAGLAGVALLVLPDVSGTARGRSAPVVPTVRPTTLRVVRDHAKVLRTLGVGVLVISAVRSSRGAVIPLWAEHIGLDAVTASLIFGLSGAVDMLLFYPAGWVMDRFGRRWAVLPCLALLGLGHLLVPLTGSATSLAAVAMVFGLGNGVGSGIVMTMGSDASPNESRAVFLGVWRLFGSAGASAGPLVVGGVVAVAGLAAASVTMGVVAAIGTIALSRWLPRRAHEPLSDRNSPRRSHVEPRA